MRPKLTEHARFEALRRNVPEEVIVPVVGAPQQRLLSSKGRVILQNIYYDETEGKEMLLRVIGEEKNDIFEVITVYKTSKIDKYWRKEST